MATENRLRNSTGRLESEFLNWQIMKKLQNDELNRNGRTGKGTGSPTKTMLEKSNKKVQNFGDK